MQFPVDLLSKKMALWESWYFQHSSRSGNIALKTKPNSNKPSKTYSYNIWVECSNSRPVMLAQRRKSNVEFGFKNAVAYPVNVGLLAPWNKLWIFANCVDYIVHLLGGKTKKLKMSVHKTWN